MNEDVAAATPGPHPQPGPFVTIKINVTDVQIHRGHREVVEIKTLGGVPLADELSQIIDGQPPVALPDDGAVTIKGGEHFISNPRTGQSS